MAAGEIAERLPGAERGQTWKRFDERTSLIEYRIPAGSGVSARQWLALGTVEDVFALVAQARNLRADREALGQIAAATLTSHHLESGLRALGASRRGGGSAGAAPPPLRTFRVVARRAGEHAFRRVDAQHAVENALRTRLPHLRHVDDDADAEFWLTIIADRALVALRLSTARMRGNSGPQAQSISASLKPTIARAMVRLSCPEENDAVVDPFCGAGTLLVERGRAAGYVRLVGGDRDPAALAKARANARAADVAIDLQEWDARALPLEDASADVILTNPPFGKKVAIRGDDPDGFYRRCVGEMRRILRPGGRLVLVTSQVEAFTRAAAAAEEDPSSAPPRLLVQQRIPVLIRGERATIFVAQAAAPHAVEPRRGKPVPPSNS